MIDGDGLQQDQVLLAGDLMVDEPDLRVREMGWDNDEQSCRHPRGAGPDERAGDGPRRDDAHGPHPGALKKSMENPALATDEVAVMIDTRRALTINEQAKQIENTDYVNSWRSQGHEETA